MMRIVVLAGGVGGARLVRGLAGLDRHIETTVVGNVGDDERVYGLHVSPDLDTIVYTVGGLEGPSGWGRTADTWRTMDELARFDVDTAFRIGDLDLATNLYRTTQLAEGVGLAAATEAIRNSFGVGIRLLPASEDPVRTRVQTVDGSWLSFQEYFVLRGHRDRLATVEYAGALQARPGPGVIQAIEAADVVVIAPSNPVLSIHPILAVPGVRAAVRGSARVVAVSPLFGGKALKGPAASVLADLGYPEGNRGILAAYDGLIHDLVVDLEDSADIVELAQPGLRIHALDTRMPDLAASTRFSLELLEAL
ncbi:MAG: 2-phospho-L-lactate transferase [Acidimicrobiia bacterium]